MKNILCIIGKTVEETSDYSKGVKENFYKYRGNSGNFLFNFALQKFLTNPQCNVTYSNEDFSNIDYINSNFDMILFSAANILNIGNKEQIVFYTNIINKIKVPVHFIGIGIQGRDNEDLELLKKADFIKDFVKAVYNTGGQFACRGHITSEFIKSLGFDNATTTGCPSLFIKNKDFQINKTEINKNNLKLLINGTEFLTNPVISKLFLEYPYSVFIDQDRFYKILYDRNKLINKIRYSRPSQILMKSSKVC